MKSTTVVTIFIVVFSLALSGIGKDGRGWSTEEKDRGDFFSSCINQPHHKVKLSVYSEQQCLAFPPT